MSLYRSSDDKVLAGVCGGLAHALDLNSGGVRIVYFLATLFGGWTLGVVLYLAGWLLLPERSTKGGSTTATESESDG